MDFSLLVRARLPMEAANSSARRKQFIYATRESSPLPQIDCFRALKHVLLDEPRLRFCNRWLSKYKQWLAVLLVVGVLDAFAVPFLPIKLGRRVVFFGLLELPTLAATLISLRCDMIRLIMGTYEFWYLFCLNAAFTIATIVAYQDTRLLSSIPSFVSTLLLALQDANFRALGFTIRFFCIIAILHMIVLLHINLHLVEQWHIVELFRYGKHAVTADNIVSTYFGFTAIILLRNAYRKHRWVRDDSGRETTVVRCIAYRCRVRLIFTNEPQLIYLQQREMSERMTQMRLVPSNQTYDSDEICLQLFASASRVRDSFRTNAWARTALRGIGATALTLMVSALLIDPIGWDQTVYAFISVSSMTASSIVCGLCLGLYQRRLFLRMTTSFDFLFLAANITALHLCVGDALAWTCKSFAVFACWIWIMWAITMDALTPDMREALGLRRQHLFSVVVLFLFLVVALVIELTVLQRWNLQDRCLFQVKAFGTTVDVQVFQIFFSCIISSLPMCLRILWRLYKAQHGELILIHGAVEYDDVPLAQRRKRKRRISASETQRAGSSVTSSRVLSWFYRQTKIQPAGAASDLFHVQFGPVALKIPRY